MKKIPVAHLSWCHLVVFLKALFWPAFSARAWGICLSVLMNGLMNGLMNEIIN